VVKTDLNSVFSDSVVYILDRLYIVFLYIKFYRFLKNSKFSLKTKGGSLYFTENTNLR
jgi:hypothetical protein